MPVCVLAFTNNMYIFAVAMSLSGFFSATFPLTFAYISDCVSRWRIVDIPYFGSNLRNSWFVFWFLLFRKKRAPAYGLALATFGLSFCIGPISGSYLASQFGNWAVFFSSLMLVCVNIVYIILVLPETAKMAKVM